MYVSEMLIVRPLGTPNSDFNRCHCICDPVLYRTMRAARGRHEGARGRNVLGPEAIRGSPAGRPRVDRVKYSGQPQLSRGIGKRLTAVFC